MNKIKFILSILFVFGCVGVAQGNWALDAGDKECLAKNIYFEAKNQPLMGQLAVAIVVMNRVADHRFPNTVCEVVQQGPTLAWTENFPVKNKCQFSWYCDGKKDVIWANYERTGKSIKLNAEAWRKSVEVAIWTLGYGS